MSDIPQSNNNNNADSLAERALPINDMNFLAALTRNLYYPLIKRRPLSHAIGTKTIGTSPVTVAHGINQIPNIVIIQMTSAGTIWQSTAADATNIYLTADAAGRTCNIEVLYFPDNLR